MDRKITIYICDDNSSYIEEVKQKVEDVLYNLRTFEISTYYDGKDLIEQWKKKSADVVLLDIDMPNKSGFEIAKELQNLNKNVLIIFITSHEDMVYQSWEYQPFWFVRKSHLRDLETVLPRLLVKIDTEYEKENSLYNIVCESKIIQIDINKAMYISSFKHDIIVKNNDGTELQARCRIFDVEKQLSKMYFVRVQNGIIVNCRFISRVTSRAVELFNGMTLQIGRDRNEYVKNEFQRFIRSR